MSLYIPLPPKRRRSRRLRKKLRIEEFQELGFEYEVFWAAEPLVEEQERFLDQLLADLVEPSGLSLGGGVNCGFVLARKGSPTEEDRLAFDAWLRRWPGVQSVKVGPLRDAWYDEPLMEKQTGGPGSIENFIGVLAGKTAKSASVDELSEAASKCWTGELVKDDEPERAKRLSPGGHVKVLALDLEATLISSAVSQFPRPHLCEFLEKCRSLFDRLVIFTKVDEGRFRQIARTLAQEGSAPDWFPAIEYVHWTGATKDLSFIPGCAVGDALLVDDLSAYVHPGQEARWVRVDPFEPPFDESDDGLAKVLAELNERVRA